MKNIEEKTLSMKRLNKILALLLEEIFALEPIERDQPLDWSINHMFSCSQLAKLLAKNRGIDIEIAGIAGAIHDLSIIRTGKFENHGIDSGPLVKQFLQEYNRKFGEEYGKISDKEIEIVVEATIHHSEKEDFSPNTFNELIKDADSLDRFLHGKRTYDFYTQRCRKALFELNQEFSSY
ncbi:MAG: HD domain-containing protein [Candidatus Heimdallarchaeaceae archaeon]